jgi:hypothetical protein
VNVAVAISLVAVSQAVAEQLASGRSQARLVDYTRSGGA